MVGLGEKHKRNLQKGLCKNDNVNKTQVCGSPYLWLVGDLYTLYQKPPRVLFCGMALNTDCGAKPTDWKCPETVFKGNFGSSIYWLWECFNPLQPRNTVQKKRK